LHHFNACRPKLVLAAGFAPALATLSTSCLCWLDYASRRKWSLQPVAAGMISLERKLTGCCMEA